MKPYANENELMNENEFRKIISNISNDPLPANNKALFEMLVGQQPIQGDDGIKYPVNMPEKILEFSINIFPEISGGFQNSSRIRGRGCIDAIVARKNM